MTEPRRLLDNRDLAGDAHELLRALSRPQEPSGAKTAELAAKLAQMTAASTGVAVPAVKTALWVKVSLALAAAVLAAAGLYLMRGSESSSPPRTLELVTPLTSVSMPVGSALLVAPPPSLSAQESSPPVSAKAAPAPSVRPSRDTLAAEEALLERARKSAAASPARALTLLDQYKREFPHGQLAAERMFLSADVLSRLGNQQAAQRERDALLRTFPRSVYAAQVRANSPTGAH